MAGPSAVVSQYSNAFASSLDILKPEQLPIAFRRYGQQGANTYLWLRSMSKKRQVARNSYNHWEQDLWNPPFVALNLVAAAAAGATQSITLSPTDLNSLNQFYPTRTDIVFYKGGKQGIITAVDVTTPTAPVLTVAPIQDGAAYSLPAVAAGETLSIISNASSEGAGQPLAKTSGYTEFTYNTQIFKTTVGATGTGMTDQTWLTINGLPDAPLYTEAMDVMAYRHSLAISHQLLVGVPGNDYLADSTTSRPFKFTEGMLTVANRLGNPRTYTPGAYNVTDFDAYGRIIDREYGADEVSYRGGLDHMNDVENGLVNYLAGTRVQYNDVQKQMYSLGVTQDMSVNIGFSYLTKGGRVFAFSREPMFTNQQTLGIPGSAKPGTAIITPMGERKDFNSGEMRNVLGYTYKGSGAYSRENETWQVSGAGPGLKVIADDLQNMYMRSEIGGEWFGVNQWIIVTPN